MELRVALLPQLAGDVSNAVCVVVDVLRATTVIATLFERNCPRVYVAAAHETASAFARSHNCLLCGETDGFKAPGFDYGNSPVEFSTMDLTDRPVVLSTTNGTKATAMVAGAQAVFLGAAINRMAVARAAWRTALERNADIVVVCSGTNNRYTLEDGTVAGLFVEAIAGLAGPWEAPQQDDAAITARRLWQTEPNLLRGWMEGIHARTLADRGFGEDVGYCAAIDRFENVPLLTTEADASTVCSPVLLIG